MANEHNLISIGDRTTSEQREIGRLGGVASGEARRARRRMREYAEIVLDLPVADKRKFNKLTRLGIKPEDVDNEMLMITALIDKACTGDVAAVKEVRAILGEDVYLPPADDDSDGLFDAIAEAVLNREI